MLTKLVVNFKEVLDEEGNLIGHEAVQELVEMTPEEEAEHLASLPPPREHVPETISDRQFFQMLALTGKIEKNEALAAVKTGTIPAALQTYVDALADEDQKFAANMLLSGAVEFQRHHPLAEAIGKANGLDSAAMDQFWIGASKL